jgi:phage baseplate assembly protein W
MTLPRLPVLAYRIAETFHGDTIQAIAFREMGDASRWPDLVALNELRPPFITDDPDLVVPGVLLAGSPVKVLAPTPFVPAARSLEDVFLSDAAISNQLLDATEDGDFALVSGIPNLRQALKHAMVTGRGELSFHPRYGSMIPRMIGEVNSPVAAILAANYAKSVVEADERISRAISSKAEADGDRINVEVVAETIYGSPVNLRVVF